MAKWTKVATLKKSKKGSTYLEVNADVTLTKGQMLTVSNPRKSTFLTEEQKAKIPEFVLADVLLAPNKPESA